MCWDIEPRCILLNMLRDREVISPALLALFRTKLHELMRDDEYVHVDLSRSALLLAIEQDPDLFDYDGSNIKRGPTASSYQDLDFLDKTANRQFPDRIKKAIHEASSLI